MSETQATPTPSADTSRDWLAEPYRADPAFANFKSPDDLAASYKSAASMVGMDKGRVVALPKDDDTAAWDGVYKQLGRPDKPEEYGVKTDGPDGALWQKALPEMHKLGLNKRQVEGLSAMMGAMGQEHAAAFADPAVAVKTHMERVSAALTSETFADATAAGFKQEWGASFDDKMHAANRMATDLVALDPKLASLFKAPQDGGDGLSNHPSIIRMLAAVGAKLAEPAGLTGGGGQNQARAMSPSDAATELSRMSADKAFGARVLAGDREAVAQYEAAAAALGATR